MADVGASSSQADVSNCVDTNLDLTKLLTEDQKNALSVYCPRCPSLILRPGHGSYDNAHRSLPDMQVVLKSVNGQNIENITSTDYQHFWCVDDIFTFENVGYTNTVDQRYKYLTCADCECGPLGVQVVDNSNKSSPSFIAIDRVVHSD